MRTSISNKAGELDLSLPSFQLLLSVTNKAANPLTCVGLHQMQCRRNPRYSPWYQLVRRLCLFDPLADSPIPLKFIFSELQKCRSVASHSDVEQMCHRAFCHFSLASQGCWRPLGSSGHPDGLVRCDTPEWVTNIQKLS